VAPDRDVEGAEGRRAVSQTVPSLNQLYFYLTEGCNLACRHCWLAPRFDPGGDRYPVLPVELFETAVREAKPVGLSGVKLTGGEPLLHPQFARLLEIVRREELGLTVETNGVLCTPALAAEIAKSPRRFVSVSIDGADAATHEWVRGVPGCFEAARQAVRNLAAADTPPQIIMSLMRCNAGQVEAVVRMAEELGASSVKFNVVQPSGRGERFQEGTDGLEVAELIELGRQVEMELAPATGLKLFFDYPPAFRPLGRIARGDGCGVCGILGILGVIAGGHYALCGIGEQVPELVFGRVGADGLAEVWRKSEVLNELRAGLPGQLEGVCARCLMRRSCLGSCVAQNYYRSGRLWAPFWFCEEAERAGLFPASRLGRPVPDPGGAGNDEGGSGQRGRDEFHSLRGG
jgi:SynChlorMet cassette radical SAM/SPASM protein ScmF